MNSRTKYAITLQVLMTCFWSFTRSTDPVSSPADGITRASLKLHMAETKSIPCPNPEDITPCVCSVNVDFSMIMDCSDVQSEEELKAVFSQDFSFTEFRLLQIYNNEHLTTLREGDLGKYSFVVISIFNCGLMEVEDLALIHSHETLLSLNLIHNKLKSVPDISIFKNLSILNLEHNALSEFPKLASWSLKTLRLDENPIEAIPRDAARLLPELETVVLHNCSITNIGSGAFAYNGNLSFVDLSNNYLTTLPENAIELHGPESRLYVANNQLKNVSVGSFSGAKWIVTAANNHLDILEEKVWREVLENNGLLYIEGNIFNCGCDIAWLIINRSLLSHVGDKPMCYDGERFLQLDPAIYESLC